MVVSPVAADINGQVYVPLSGLPDGEYILHVGDYAVTGPQAMVPVVSPGNHPVAPDAFHFRIVSTPNTTAVRQPELARCVLAFVRSCL